MRGLTWSNESVQGESEYRKRWEWIKSTNGKGSGPRNGESEQASLLLPTHAYLSLVMYDTFGPVPSAEACTSSSSDSTTTTEKCVRVDH